MRLDITHLHVAETEMVTALEGALAGHNWVARELRYLEAFPRGHAEYQERMVSTAKVGRTRIRGLVAGIRVLRLAMGAATLWPPATSQAQVQAQRALVALVAANIGAVRDSWVEEYGPPQDPQTLLVFRIPRVTWGKIKAEG